MRRFFVLTLVIALFFGMTGCKEATKDVKSIDTAPQPKVFVASGNVKSFSEAQLKAALEELNKVIQLVIVDEYKFRIGDEFTVSVLNHPEWETKCTVSPGGKILFGYLDKEIKVKGLTLTQVSTLLTKELEIYFNEPMVKIDGLKYSEDLNTVNVTGFFRKTGKIKIEEGDTIVDIVAQAGGIERKYYSRVASSPDSVSKSAIDWNRAHIARYNETKKYHEIIPYVDLYKLLVQGDYRFNIKVKHNDIICLPEATFDTNKVYVLGAVHKPGVYSNPTQLTLIEALSLAGGFDNLRAEEKWVYIIRNSTDKKEIQVYVAELRKILTGEKDQNGNLVVNPLLQESDIIFVDTAGITDFGDWLRNFQPFWGATLLSASSVAYNVSNIGN